MKKNLFMAFAGLAASLLYISNAQATSIPTLTISLQEDSLTALTATSTSGSVMETGVSYGDFILNNVTGLGAPTLNSPNLNLQTLNISTQSLNGSHTLTIKLTETGLVAASPNLPIISAFTGILQGVSSETVSSYYDPGDGAFATTYMLDTSTFTSLSNNSSQVATEHLSNLSAPFSETEIIQATFMPASGSSDSLNSSATLTSAPEPASCALIGAGLLGVAAIRRRRSAK